LDFDKECSIVHSYCNDEDEIEYVGYVPKVRLVKINLGSTRYLYVEDIDKLINALTYLKDDINNLEKDHVH